MAKKKKFLTNKKTSFFIGILLFILTYISTESLSLVYDFTTVAEGQFEKYDLDVAVSIKSHLAHFIFVALISFFGGILSFIILDYREKLKEINKDISNDLEANRRAIAKGFYLGFHSLLAENSKLSLRNFHSVTSNGTSYRMDVMRPILLEFIAQSMDNVAKRGFTMFDCSVSDYVRYIASISGISKNVIMTCVVRPFWFVTDFIEDFSIEPYLEGDDDYGKGEHLRYFIKENGDEDYQRCLILDDEMIIKILLTAKIDKYIYELGSGETNCPICKSTSTLNKICPIHFERDEDYSANELPEIYWFEYEVNKDIELIYNFIDSKSKDKPNFYDSSPELQDLVYIKEPNPEIELQFEFTTLDKGNLWIRWGDKIECRFHKIEKEDLSEKSVTWVETKDKGEKQYKLYSEFKDVINKLEIFLKFDTYSNQRQNSFINIINDIKINIEDHLNEQAVMTGNYGNESRSKKLLYGGGGDEFKKVILRAIDDLMKDIKDNDFRVTNVYNELCEHFKSNGTPKLFFVTEIDHKNPLYPLRICSWQNNWNTIKNG